ncbi:MAG: transglutaminase domain-containing protein [Phycisphaerales bacterium]|nr:transglutaminase domain-containing protein [Phycisphaerales bacterium]
MPQPAARFFGAYLAMFAASMCAASQASTAPASQSVTAAPIAPADSVVALATRIAPDDQTLWYVISLNNVSAGWMRTHTKKIDSGFRTESETRLRMAREKKILSMSTTAWMEEDDQGHALRGGQTQTGGGLSVRVTWESAADGIRERRTQGAMMKERLLPAISQDALAPVAVRRAVQAAISAGKTNFSLLILDPAQGVVPSQNRWQKIDGASLLINGNSMECTRWKLTGPQIPIGNEEWVNSNGEVVQSESPTGLGVLKNVMCDQATAMATLEIAKPPVEVMVASFVKVDPPLSDVLNKRSLSLLVKAKKPPIMPPPQEGFQRVKRNSDGSFLVTIDLDKSAEPSQISVDSGALCLESSPIIDWKDPAVLALKESALAQASSNMTANSNAPPIDDKSETVFDANALRKAKAFRSAVANHIINQNLGSAFASASETAQSKSGDCTEHAVLLAALLRAEGIPSRVAAGLVWADYFAGEKNVFAWHLWTQALINDRWVDLDATLPADGEAFHVGHVLLAITPLTDAASDPAWSSLLASMGNLSIEVSGGANK